MVSTRSKAGASTGGKRAADAPKEQSDAKKPKTDKEGKLEVGEEGEVRLKNKEAEAEDDGQEREDNDKEELNKKETVENEGGDDNGQQRQPREPEDESAEQKQGKTRSGPGESKQEVGRGLAGPIRLAF